MVEVRSATVVPAPHVGSSNIVVPHPSSDLHKRKTSSVIVIEASTAQFVLFIIALLIAFLSGVYTQQRFQMLAPAPFHHLSADSPLIIVVSPPAISVDGAMREHLSRTLLDDEDEEDNEEDDEAGDDDGEEQDDDNESDQDDEWYDNEDADSDEEDVVDDEHEDDEADDDAEWDETEEDDTNSEYVEMGNDESEDAFEDSVANTIQPDQKSIGIANIESFTAKTGQRCFEANTSGNVNIPVWTNCPVTVGE